MSSGYPNSPALTKAALISMGGIVPVPRLIMLQYNPEELGRSLEPDYETVGAGLTGTDLVAGPPRETLTLKARISAIDQLQGNDGTAIACGIHPQLALLELMLFPSSLSILADTAQMELGVLEIVPPQPPLTILVWGAQRVLPVQMTSYSVSETLHDTRLNPIDAEVSLAFQVLTYRNFSATQAGFSLYLANLAQREMMAAMGGVANAASLVAGILKR